MHFDHRLILTGCRKKAINAYANDTSAIDTLALVAYATYNLREFSATENSYEKISPHIGCFALVIGLYDNCRIVHG